MLPIDAKLDYETLGHVVRSGHSRVPVYQMVEVPDVNLAAPNVGETKTKMVKKVLGSLLVKSCVLLDPEGTLFRQLLRDGILTDQTQPHLLPSLSMRSLPFHLTSLSQICSTSFKKVRKLADQL
jgi:hypothetical protein